MDERRRLMFNAKPKPLIVFKYGDDELTNGQFAGGNPRMYDGIIIASYADSYPVNIGGVDFTKYKTLHIECYADVQYYSEHYEDFYVGYGDSVGAYLSHYDGYVYAPGGYRTVVLDISALRGTGWYIKATAWSSGTANVKIKNVWLEG